MKKRIISTLLAFAIIAQPVYASVLGEVITSWRHIIANGTDFYKNTFISEQSGVGKQAEYYAEYIPNKNVVPAVVNGESIWGLRTIKEAEEYMKKNGMVPLIGVNASYFSWKTGIPMGHVISDGKVVSKDTSSYQAIGFTSTGEAFILPLAIETTLKSNETVIDIAHINKYNQDIMDIVNLYTTDFGESNHTETASLNIILGNIEGELSINKTLTATVEEKFNYTSSIKIPENKIVLTINETGNADLYSALNSLNIGDTVEISNKVLENGEIWERADSALGSVGETLIKNGEIQEGFPAGAAPRTAVGITESGSVIFYVIDGRQKPYSYGVQVKTLAKRMKELGCVEAINLDGGGSTAISGIYPGTDESAVLNSPSEGVLRTCANYIFLKNNQSPTGELGGLFIYPFEQHYLSGYSEKLTVAAVDSAYFKTDVPENIAFSVVGTESTINEGGILNATGNGKFTVEATNGDITGNAQFTVYDTPTEINTYNSETNSEIKELTLKKGDKIKLKLAAKYNHIDLKTSEDCFEIKVTNGLGEIKDNELIITSDGGKGILEVTAGEMTKKIPVTVENEYIFTDISNHWAREAIKLSSEKGYISGYDAEEGMIFKPDNHITREEFAAIMCRFLSINTEEYMNYDLTVFSDGEEVSEWAKPYIAAMFAMGLITGKQDGENLNFAPRDKLTRAEAMTILGRTVEKIEEKVNFADADEIPKWAESHIMTLVSMGIVNGYEDNTIRPNNNVTRAEAVTLINKMP